MRHFAGHWRCPLITTIGTDEKAGTRSCPSRSGFVISGLKLAADVASKVTTDVASKVTADVASKVTADVASKVTTRSGAPATIPKRKLGRFCARKNKTPR
jgi:hypothetical protein